MKPRKRPGITLTELIIVIIIIAIGATLAVSAGVSRGKLHEDNVRTNLSLAFQSQRDHFTYNEAYTLNWDKLHCRDLNDIDHIFVYTITSGDLTKEFQVKATGISNPGRWFQIDETGVITENP